MSFQQEIDAAIKAKRLYFVGECLPPDWYAGFLLWEKMAEAGNPKAQYNVGRCYNRGDGVDQDLNLAKFWYFKAAEHNDPRALFNLWLFFSDKKSPEFNSAIAREYLDRATELNESRAIEFHRTEKENAEKLAREQDEARYKEEETRKRRLQLDFHKYYFEKVKDFLENNQNLNVKSLIVEAVGKNVLWIENLIPYFELKVLSSKIEKEIKKETFAGGLFQGTTQYYTVEREFNRARIKLLNGSSKELRGSLKGRFSVKPGEVCEVVTDWIERKKEESPRLIEYIVTEDIIPQDMSDKCSHRYFTIRLAKPIVLKAGWFS